MKGLLADVPMLSEVLEGSPNSGVTVSVTAYGKLFTDKSITGRMRP